MERGFRVPFVPVFPLIGAALCVYLMTKLPAETWLRFIAWLALGPRDLRGLRLPPLTPARSDA